MSVIISKLVLPSCLTRLKNKIYPNLNRIIPNNRYCTVYQIEVYQFKLQNVFY